MCRYTAYVHICDHLAAGPILSNPCSYGCGLGPVYGDTVRTDLGVPYRIREGMVVDYIMIDSLCCGCQFERNPYEDVEIPGADEMTWHIPSVICREEFRPVDFGAGVKPEAEEMKNVSGTMSPHDTSTNTDSWSLLEKPSAELAPEICMVEVENKSGQQDTPEKQTTKSPLFDLHAFLHEPMAETKLKTRKEKRESRQKKRANQTSLRLSNLQATKSQKPVTTILQRRRMKRLSRQARKGYTTEPQLLGDLRVYTNIHVDIGQATQDTTTTESNSAVFVSKPSPFSAVKPTFGYPVDDTSLQPAPLNLRKIMRKRAINKLEDLTNQKQEQSPYHVESESSVASSGGCGSGSRNSSKPTKLADYMMEFDHLFSYI